MKRILAFLGSLFVFTGLKAQVDPPVKKETTPPVINQPVTESTEGLKIIKKSADGKIIPGETIKSTDTHIKRTGPIKDSASIKGMKEMKEMKDMKSIKLTKDLPNPKTNPAGPIKETGNTPIIKY